MRSRPVARPDAADRSVARPLAAARAAATLLVAAALGCASRTAPAPAVVVVPPPARPAPEPVSAVIPRTAAAGGRAPVSLIACESGKTGTLRVDADPNASAALTHETGRRGVVIAGSGTLRRLRGVIERVTIEVLDAPARRRVAFAVRGGEYADTDESGRVVASSAFDVLAFVSSDEPGTSPPYPDVELSLAGKPIDVLAGGRILGCRLENLAWVEAFLAGGAGAP